MDAIAKSAKLNPLNEHLTRIQDGLVGASDNRGTTAIVVLINSEEMKTVAHCEHPADILIAITDIMKSTNTTIEELINFQNQQNETHHPDL